MRIIIFEAMYNLKTAGGNKKVNEFREALSNLKLHTKTLTQDSNSTSKMAICSGLKISKRGLPKFQLEDTKKPFPQEKVYKSVDYFLNNLKRSFIRLGKT